MMILDKITRIYRFNIFKDNWVRSGGNDNFIAYKLYGSSVHKVGNDEMILKKDMIMVANSSDSYAVTQNVNDTSVSAGGCIAIHFTTLTPFDMHLSMFDCSSYPQIKNEFFKILDSWERFTASCTPSDEYECVSHFYSIMSMILKLNSKNAHPRIADAKDFLERNYMNSTLSVNDAASHISLSPRRMNELFLSEYGQTPAKYLTSLRISSAVELLDDPDLKIADIAALCGYSSANYFIRAFKKDIGITPDAFRKHKKIPEKTGINILQ